eukprot:TRINITY_DN21656_c0_g1_i2.p1 TRINITY_DN21656_c0_g1~~TRINITY_DN21656_c0_g1_i2.p1  ORF type:complete len:501 (+),score=102.31 TRINITY_DN21656_c0_g1_i2:1195-2697(+)
MLARLNLDPARCGCYDKDSICYRVDDGRGHSFADSGFVDAWSEVVEGLGPVLSPRGSVLPRGPVETLPTTYATAGCTELRGARTFSGKILQLKLGEAIIDVELDLHEDGFAMTRAAPEGNTQRLAQLWSPFMLVEKCQVKPSMQTQSFAVFKLSTLNGDFGALTSGTGCLYFAVSADEPEEERDKWVTRVSEAINGLSQSLFPPHAIVVQPVPWVETTSTRIMAGYLLRADASKGVTLIYAELHAHSEDVAKMLIYKDEWCEHEIATVFLKGSTVLGNRKGNGCCIFGVDNELFCARSEEEMQLWMRAVSNVKVKLMFQAPNPSPEDLSVYRQAVGEKLGELDFPQLSPRGPPLLLQAERRPDVVAVSGDTQVPDPIDDAAEWSPDPGPDVEVCRHLHSLVAAELTGLDHENKDGEALRPLCRTANLSMKPEASESECVVPEEAAPEIPRGPYSKLQGPQGADARSAPPPWALAAATASSNAPLLAERPNPQQGYRQVAL